MTVKISRWFMSQGRLSGKYMSSLQTLRELCKLLIKVSRTEEIMPYPCKIVSKVNFPTLPRPGLIEGRWQTPGVTLTSLSQELHAQEDWFIQSKHVLKSTSPRFVVTVDVGAQHEFQTGQSSSLCKAVLIPSQTTLTARLFPNFFFFFAHWLWLTAWSVFPLFQCIPSTCCMTGLCSTE